MVHFAHKDAGATGMLACVEPCDGNSRNSFGCDPPQKGTGDRHDTFHR